MESPAPGDFNGLLFKKKMDHGRFEDPYRNKFQCWLHTSTAAGKKEAFMFIRALGPDKNPTGVAEKIDLSTCKVEREEKNKFSIIRSGQEQHVKLKAESQPEAEEWMKNIQAAISLVTEEVKVAEPPPQKPDTPKAEAVKDTQASKQASQQPAPSPVAASPSPRIKEEPNVTVLIKDITHLPQLDEGAGPCDAFAVATVGPSQPQLRTPRASAAADPGWARPMAFCSGGAHGAELRVELFAPPAASGGADRYLGCVRAPLPTPGAAPAGLPRAQALPVLNREGFAVRGHDGQVPSAGGPSL